MAAFCNREPQLPGRTCTVPAALAFFGL